MICYNSAFEQGNLDLWRYRNAFIIIIIITLATCTGHDTVTLATCTGHDTVTLATCTSRVSLSNPGNMYESCITQ